MRDLADLNGQCRAWLTETANARVHGTTREVPAERLGPERAALLPLPTGPYIPLITVGRRVSRDGFISYNGNQYSVPEGLDRREVGVRATLSELQLLAGEHLIASHPLLEGRGERRLDPSHRRPAAGKSAAPPPAPSAPQAASDDPLALLLRRPDRDLEALQVERRSLAVYEEVLR